MNHDLTVGHADEEATTCLAFSKLSPGDLQPGDLVLLDGQRVRVLTEPLTSHRGLGVFDEFRIMLGVQIEVPGTSKAAFHKWELDARLDVLRDLRDSSQPAPTTRRLDP